MNFLRKLFSKKPKEDTSQPIDPVLDMVRVALKAGDKKKTQAIFSELTMPACAMVLDHLSPDERMLVEAAMLSH